MNNQRGKFIVLYGINNLGKTTQAKMLVHKLITHGARAEYIKYPIYDLAPSGVVLNNYLRGGNFFNLSAREAQIFYAANRTQYEKELIKKLEAGITIIAEDYTGTGLAWGIGAGVDELFLKYINSHLLKENLAFLFDGERFTRATERGHKHETNNELLNEVRRVHLKLGKEFNWKKINANLSVEEIHQQLWSEILKIIKIQKNKFDTRHSTFGIRVERLSPSAKLPKKSRADDAGYDLFANDYYTLFPGDREGIKTGIKMQVPKGCAGLIWDKSGVAKDGLHTMGGVIDANYRGEIIVLVKNLSNDIYNIARGQKIAQILIQKVESPEIVEGKIKDETERGENGFGSSGMF
jgi:dUTP pyrophosphatase